jgi:hypothetical protein
MRNLVSGEPGVHDESLDNSIEIRAEIGAPDDRHRLDVMQR